MGSALATVSELKAAASVVVGARVRVSLGIENDGVIAAAVGASVVVVMLDEGLADDGAMVAAVGNEGSGSEVMATAAAGAPVSVRKLGSSAAHSPDAAIVLRTDRQAAKAYAPGYWFSG